MRHFYRPDVDQAPLPEIFPRPVVVNPCPRPEQYGNPIGPPDDAPQTTDFACFVVPPKSASERWRLGFGEEKDEEKKPPRSG